MSLPGLLVALVGLAVIVLFVASPLLARPRSGSASAAAVPSPSAAAADLASAYERIKSALRDLDEDHTLGKLDDDAYHAERERWLTEGARVLAALDSLQPGQ